MVAPIEQRFNAAVNVIRGLPKHGSYQPSNDMLLRFYAYYKQATQGPCTQQRPAFWNVVDKAKWDAYNALGKMPADRAMELYVDELKKIIETMSYTDNVAEFMGSVGELGAVDIGDLEAVAPEAIKTVRSRPNSPFASRESSPVRAAEPSSMATAVLGGGSLHDEVGQMLLSNGYHSDEYTNGHSATDYSDDEYIDTVEDDTILHTEPIPHRFSRSKSRLVDGYRVDVDSHGLVGNGGHTANGTTPATATTTTTMHVVSANVEPALHQMLRCVEAMRVDLQQINNRINIVERSLADVRQLQHHHGGKQVSVSVHVNVLSYVSRAASEAAASCTNRLPAHRRVQCVGSGGADGAAAAAGRSPVWWPFAGITPAWFIAMAVLWPLVAPRMLRMMRNAASSSSSRRR